MVTLQSYCSITNTTAALDSAHHLIHPNISQAPNAELWACFLIFQQGVWPLGLAAAGLDPDERIHLWTGPELP